MKVYYEHEVKKLIEFAIEKVDRHRALHNLDGISDSTYETIFSEQSDWIHSQIRDLDIGEELYEFIDELS